MTRWEPGGRERLQQAAMALFQEHGYAAVTVADIADQAGLTKRSFFNHFPDKREVPFAGAKELEVEVVDRLRASPGGELPFDAVIAALADAGRGLAQFAPYAAMRRELIASSVDLQERDLMKSAALADAIASVMREWGVSARASRLASASAVAVFVEAFDAWGANPTAEFGDLMASGAHEMQSIVGHAAAT
ncbi:TetR/AcrR family transcriptional regulator [Pengzhenrongella sicca]|uniref:TetR family transcriptional regulator n=1 Tax=Pengzhenrongella sicca TaxID=2819238 RepID=A0A8A4ZFV2_9MICO|nr:TetR/AcrR family transcriptional regulator [Pengzhenrongella sicca]QTE29367.1 TetR family transcriptional regulator [Pengzhenrongella sicca]